MKERPILFSGPMVRAILSGRKTQTRRVVKWVKSLPNGRGWDCVINRRTGGSVPLIDGKLQWSPYGGAPYEPYPHVEQCCPFGEPGDRLWVKETHCDIAHEGYPSVWFYRADGDEKPDWVKHWKPSIFMKREASRIVLEIVSVQVERLQDISEADAVAEGIHRFEVNDCVYFHARPTAPTEEHFNSAVMAYRDLWKSINGAGSWDANPWVWVVEFKRL